jgi:hypothetical protein
MSAVARNRWFSCADVISAGTTRLVKAVREKNGLPFSPG